MVPFKGFFALFCALGLAALACGVSVDLGTQPSANPPSQLSVQEGVATGVAQTLQAFTLEALSVAPTGTPSPTATATSTPIPLPATLSVSVATNCRTGPNINFGLVITLRPGTVATIVGQDAADNYWIIDAPGYPGTVCWLSGEYASVSGYTGFLYSPATPVMSYYTLDEPRNLHASCTAQHSSDDHGGWWDDGKGWDDGPPWGDKTPWADGPPSADETPWSDGGHGGGGTHSGDGGHGGDGTQGGNGSPRAIRTPWAIGTPWAFGTPWANWTPWANGLPWGNGPQSNTGPQGVSYTQRDHITSWTIDLKWKNTDPDQTGVRVYKNGRRVATLGPHASSYTDTISDNWDDDITYGVQAFNGWTVSSIVSVDVGRCN
jgi:hypothetical protein